MSSRVGRYTLLSTIASGGMATVHRARLDGAVGFERQVALKQLQPSLASDPDFVSMLLDEARITSSIQHPNVVQVFDVVVETGEVFIVMDYVRGPSLSALLKGGKPSRGVAVAIAIEALRGLAAAHAATGPNGVSLEIVHRDVSPQNILVGVDGIARVLDFGIAKALGRATHTQEGQVRGKLAYMSPEQAGAQHVDARADLYSLGIVLWEMLAGRSLNQANDVVGVMRQALQGFTREALWLAGEPGELNELVATALQIDREQRFPTASHFADALEALGLRAPVSEVQAWVNGSRALENLVAAESLAPRLRASDPKPVATGTVTARPATPKPASVTVEPRRRPLGLLAWGAVPLLLGAALTWGLLPLSHEEVASTPPVALDEGAPDAGRLAATEPEREAIAAPASPPPVAEPPRAPAPAKTVSKGRIKPVRAPKVSAQSAPKAPSVDCTNPWVVDADGNPRFRRECLAQDGAP